MKTRYLSKFTFCFNTKRRCKSYECESSGKRSYACRVGKRCQRVQSVRNDSQRLVCVQGTEHQHSMDYEEVSFEEGLLFLYGNNLLNAPELTPEEAAEKKDNIERLWQAYKALDIEGRELIYLLYLCSEPLTEKQAASVLHISQQTVNKRKMRILRKMKSFWL